MKRVPFDKSLQNGAQNLFSYEKAAVDKEWEKLEKLPAWQLSNVKR